MKTDLHKFKSDSEVYQ